jgi:GWxTD domain-containing protein
VALETEEIVVKKRHIGIIILFMAGSAISFARIPEPEPQLSKADERWLTREVAAIVTVEESRHFRAITNEEERREFRERFWARRDPTPGTAENEFKAEFEHRVEIADERFRARVGPGSASDMGRLFILLGFPANVTMGRGAPIAVTGTGELSGGQAELHEGSGSEIDPRGAGAGAPATQRTQTWHYQPDASLGIPDGLDVQFRAHPGFGYRLVRSESLDEILESRRKSFISRPELDLHGTVLATPARALLDELIERGEESGELSIAVTPSFFRSREQSVYVPVLFETDASSFTWSNDESRVTFFGAVTDANGHVVQRFEEQRVLTRDSNSPSFDMPFQLEPGSYTLSLGVLDEVSGRHGSRVDEVSVPNFDRNGPSLSSIVLFSNSEKTEEMGGVPGSAFQFAGFKFEPRRTRAFARGESLGLFFYVYGVSGEQAPTVSYGFFQNGREIGHTEPRPLLAAGDRALASDEIPLSGFAPGVYTLAVEVTHPSLNEPLEERLRFLVAETESETVPR